MPISSKRLSLVYLVSFVAVPIQGFVTPVLVRQQLFSSCEHPSSSARCMDSTANIPETTFEPPEDDNSGDDGAQTYSATRFETSRSDARWPKDISETRRNRLEQEEIIAKRFVSGDALHLLRQKVLNMRIKLQEARETGNTPLISRLSRSILRAQQMDAEFIYQVSLERMEAATQAGLLEEAETYRREVMHARSALPQFNMGGLWIGRFGEEFQMVNISYVGDTLLAYKVTGNRNIPKGQISFQVDLSPKNYKDALPPIELNEDSAKQWGRKFLQRFTGKGQVASPGFQNNEWIEGQLIMVDKYFSFAWLPIAHQVFFGRPSPELTLKMLRESQNSAVQSSDRDVVRSSLSSPSRSIEAAVNRHSDIQSMRAHLTRCWEETENIQDELEVSDGIFRSHDQSYYYEQSGCFE